MSKKDHFFALHVMLMEGEGGKWAPKQQLRLRAVSFLSSPSVKRGKDNLATLDFPLPPFTLEGLRTKGDLTKETAWSIKPTILANDKCKSPN